MKILKLLGNRLLIEPLPEQTVSRGITLPESVVTRQPIGIVRMLGTGNGNVRANTLMADIKVGDLVRVDHNFGSQEIQIEGKLCRIHSLKDIQLIL